MAAGEVLAAAGMVAAAGGGVIVGSYWTRRANEQLVQRLHTDELTLLPNRLGYQREMARRAAAGEGYALGFVDLDHFKAVNDRLGHDAGDEVLREFAGRLIEVVGPPTGFVARLQGDEFVVVLPALSVDQTVAHVMAIHEDTALPMVVDGHWMFPWASIGFALAEPGEAPRQVLRRAEAAMYRAKRTESGFALFDPEADVVAPASERRPRRRQRDVAAADRQRGVAAA